MSARKFLCCNISFIPNLLSLIRLLNTVSNYMAYDNINTMWVCQIGDYFLRTRLQSIISVFPDLTLLLEKHLRLNAHLLTAYVCCSCNSCFFKWHKFSFWIWIITLLSMNSRCFWSAWYWTLKWKLIWSQKKREWWRKRRDSHLAYDEGGHRLICWSCLHLVIWSLSLFAFSTLKLICSGHILSTSLSFKHSSFPDFLIFFLSDFAGHLFRFQVHSFCPWDDMSNKSQQSVSLQLALGYKCQNYVVWPKSSLGVSII